MALLADPAKDRVADPPHRAPPRGSTWTRFEFRWLTGAATVLALLATAIMLVEAFSRGFLSHSYFWAEESVRYLMIWAFFLTLGAAGRGGYHIRTEMLVDMLSPRLRRICHIAASLAGVAFSVILFAAAIPQITRYYSMGMMTESTLDLPMWALFLAMPLGAVLLGVYYIGCIIRALRGENPFAAQPGTGGANDILPEPQTDQPAGPKA